MSQTQQSPQPPDTSPAWGEKGNWPEGTYTYISGHRNIRVYDGGTHSGGHDPLPYAGQHGNLPPFRDGTECRFDACDHCHVYGPVMHVKPHKLLPMMRWLCAECCPAGALPRL